MNASQVPRFLHLPPILRLTNPSQSLTFSHSLIIMRTSTTIVLSLIATATGMTIPVPANMLSVCALSSRDVTCADLAYFSPRTRSSTPAAGYASSPCWLRRSG